MRTLTHVSIVAVLVVFVQQCSITANGLVCTTISANNSGSGPTTQVSTSSKPTAAGHVYRACASWTTLTGWHVVGACSPFVVAPT